MKSNEYIILAKAWLENMAIIPENKIAEIEEKSAKDALLADLAADTISDISWAHHYKSAGDKDCFNVYVKAVAENIAAYEGVLSEINRHKRVKEVYLYYKDMRFFTSEDRLPHIAAEKASLQQMIVAHQSSEDICLMAYVSEKDHSLLIESGLLKE